MIYDFDPRTNRENLNSKSYPRRLLEDILTNKIVDSMSFGTASNYTTRSYGPNHRIIYEGVGSYNHRYSDEITFYADHTELLVDGTGETLNITQESDVSTLRVSKLDGDCSSVVADFYENEQIDFIPNVPTYQYEATVTYFFTDDDSE